MPSDDAFEAASSTGPRADFPDGEPSLLSAEGARSGKIKPPKEVEESEITLEGMVSYGNWKIFAAGEDSKLFTSGFEYDKHIWGHVIGSQIDYVAEVLPFVLLDEPAKLDVYGNSRSTKKRLLPGFAFSPIGARFQWRSTKAIKPYFVVKGGAIGFTEKALSPKATYFDFTLQESIGVYVRMNERFDLRLGIFGDFHMSNAYITDFNPGLDVMNSNVGLTYHFKN